MLRHVTQIGWRRKRFVVIPMLAVFAVPMALSIVMEQTYLSESTIEVEPNEVISPVITDVERDVERDDPVQALLDMTNELLVSRSFLSSVALASGLEDDRRQVPDKVIDRLGGGYEVFPVGPHRMLVRVRADDAAKAQRIARATVQLLLTERRREITEDGQATVRFFEEQVDVYQDNLADRSAVLEQFRTAHPEVELSSEKQQILNALAVLRAQRVGKDRVVDPANLPGGPARGKLVMLAILSLVVAVAAAGGLVVLAEYLDIRIRDARDTTESSGIAVLAEVRAR